MKAEEAGPSSHGGVFQFDVFLSFSGTDARQGFTSHLYKELNRLGVITFIDSEELQKGERISQLFQYMESSQIFVPILSKNYAQSKWCLLEAAKMVKIVVGDQQKTRLIIPVFYYVDPSDVKDDGGLYQSAAMELGNSRKLEDWKVEECIGALKTIASISGFHLKRGTNVSEAELVTRICKRVQELFGRVPFGVQPIGFDSQIGELITMLEAQSDGVCIIGICGMGGIGKTTIAKAIRDKLFSQFDGSSFIDDVGAMEEREGLPAIQQKLICGVLNLKRGSISIDTVDEGRNIIKQRLNSKRVLLVLDNIVKLDQLQQLSGDHLCHEPKDLFGKGSKIIVTTRDKAVLLSYGIKEHQIYYPEELKDPWRLQLFYRHAFMHKPPAFELLDLAKEVAGIAGGLPLVLVAVGSVFAGLSTQEEWEAKRKRATYLWDDCSPENAIRVLKERNLISIDDEDRFRMHDLIQEMGRWILSGEGNLGPYMNSRLCYSNEESITSMNSEDKGKVEGIVLNMEEECTETNLTTKVFVDMPKLRLLHLKSVKFLEPKIDHFPKKLKWLQWRGCELELVTIDRTSFKNLAILDLKGKAAEPSSSSSPPRTVDKPSYDVILSFSGKDTGKGFTSHLYNALIQRGISIFGDSVSLEKGGRIEELFSYIEAPKIFVPVLSKGYADSRWCLWEITKRVECGKPIIPIFFDVDPSDARKLSGPFAAAFQQHGNSNRVGEEELRKWKDALKEIGCISGFCLNDMNGNEAELIQMVVQRMSLILNKTARPIPEYLVGMDSHIRQIYRLLVGMDSHIRQIYRLSDLTDKEVRMIGIVGMGGVTIATVVYNMLHSNFEDSSFISNVRENFKRHTGGVASQQRLIKDILKVEHPDVADVEHVASLIQATFRSKKVLVILDDADHIEQLEELAGKRDWFGSGSRIIVTSRDSRVLLNHGVKEEDIYRPELLDVENSLTLFNSHAL
ncbi:putative disease resistance protein [Nymphaea thermarum]|nr:putative disease resistance protein [Nymphaea thermarum]